MVKFLFERVFMLLLCMLGFVAFFLNNAVLLCVYVGEGRVKETRFVFRSKLIVVLSCWEVNSQSLLWLLRNLGVSHWSRNELRTWAGA